MTDHPNVSVIVCTYNRCALLDRTLSALAEQTYPHDRFEVVVVDNGSQDDTAALLDHWQARAPWTLRVLRLPRNERVGRARNLAIGASSGAVLAFTDDDCRPAPTWIEALEHGMTPCVDTVQGLTMPDPEQPRHLRSRSQWVLREDHLFETCNIAYRRSALEKIGEEPFRGELQDELGLLLGRRLASQPFGEDVELGWRLRRMGARTAFAPEAVVHHEVLPPSLEVALHRAAVGGTGFPLLTREVPELRDHLYWHGWFLGAHRPGAWALTFGALGLLGRRSRRPALILLLAWAVDRVKPGQPGTRDRLAGLPHRAAEDLVETAALAYGSARSGCVVL